MNIITILLGIPIVCGISSISTCGNIFSDSLVFYLFAIFLIFSVPSEIIYFILNIIILVNNNKMKEILNIKSDEYINELIKTFIKETQ